MTQSEALHSMRRAKNSSLENFVVIAATDLSPTRSRSQLANAQRLGPEEFNSPPVIFQRVLQITPLILSSQIRLMSPWPTARPSRPRCATTNPSLPFLPAKTVQASTGAYPRCGATLRPGGWLVL